MLGSNGKMTVVAASLMCATLGFAQDEGRRGPQPAPVQPLMREGVAAFRGGMHGAMGDAPFMGEGADIEGMVSRLVANSELAARAGLTEEQTTKLKDGLFDLKQKGIELKAQVELAGMEQAKLMTAKEIDEGALMKAVEKAGELRTEQAKLRVKGLVLMKKTLKPEQAEQIRNMMREHMRERFREARGGEGTNAPRQGDDVRDRRPPMQQERRGDAPRDEQMRGEGPRGHGQRTDGRGGDRDN